MQIARIQRPARNLATDRFQSENADGSVTEIALYGACYSIDRNANWSLSPLQKSGDELKPLNAELAERIGVIASSFGAKNIFAPVPTKFNGRIAHRKELREVLPLPHGITLLRGAYADGVEILPGEAYAVSVGGCPVIIASRNSRVLVAHAGLASLFDIENPERPSVVDNIVQTLGSPRNENDGLIEVHIRYAIPPHVFTHPLDDPLYAAKNRKLCAALTERWGKQVLWGENIPLGCINLFKLISKQFEKHKWISLSVGSYLPPDIELEHQKQILAYHTRQREPFRSRRNLVLVARSK